MPKKKKKNTTMKAGEANSASEASVSKSEDQASDTHEPTESEKSFNSSAADEPGINSKELTANAGTVVPETSTSTANSSESTEAVGTLEGMDPEAAASLTWTTLRALASSLGNTGMLEILKPFDADGTGMLNKNEFKAALASVKLPGASNKVIESIMKAASQEEGSKGSKKALDYTNFAATFAPSVESTIEVDAAQDSSQSIPSNANAVSIEVDDQAEKDEFLLSDVNGSVLEKTSMVHTPDPRFTQLQVSEGHGEGNEVQVKKAFAEELMVVPGTGNYASGNEEDTTKTSEVNVQALNDDSVSALIAGPHTVTMACNAIELSGDYASVALNSGGNAEEVALEKSEPTVGSGSSSETAIGNGESEIVALDTDMTEINTAKKADITDNDGTRIGISDVVAEEISGMSEADGISSGSDQHLTGNDPVVADDRIAANTPTGSDEEDWVETQSDELGSGAAEEEWAEYGSGDGEDDDFAYEAGGVNVDSEESDAEWVEDSQNDDTNHIDDEGKPIDGDVSSDGRRTDDQIEVADEAMINAEIDIHEGNDDGQKEQNEEVGYNLDEVVPIDKIDLGGEGRGSEEAGERAPNEPTNEDGADTEGDDDDTKEQDEGNLSHEHDESETNVNDPRVARGSDGEFEIAAREPTDEEEAAIEEDKDENLSHDLEEDDQINEDDLSAEREAGGLGEKKTDGPPNEEVLNQDEQEVLRVEEATKDVVPASFDNEGSGVNAPLSSDEDGDPNGESIRTSADDADATNQAPKALPGRALPTLSTESPDEPALLSTPVDAPLDDSNSRGSDGDVNSLPAPVSPGHRSSPLVVRRRGSPSSSPILPPSPSAPFSPTVAPPRATTTKGAGPPRSRKLAVRGGHSARNAASGPLDESASAAVNLDDCTAHAAARLLLRAHTAVARFRDLRTLVTLRTRCVLLHRNPPPTPAGRVEEGSAHSIQLPKYYTAPTLVTLHVLHGQLWCSEAGAAANGPASAFQLLCGLNPGFASLEGTLIQSSALRKQRLQQQRQLRLVLTLRAVSPATDGAHAGRRVELLLFPKDSVHLVELASTLLYFLDPAVAANGVHARTPVTIR